MEVLKTFYFVKTFFTKNEKQEKLLQRIYFLAKGNLLYQSPYKDIKTLTNVTPLEQTNVKTLLNYQTINLLLCFY